MMHRRRWTWRGPVVSTAAAILLAMGGCRSAQDSDWVVAGDASAPVAAPAGSTGQVVATVEGSLRARAVEQVLASARSGDPFLRANAIEAAQHLPDRVGPLAQLGLEDPHPAVRFAALASIGKLRLTDLGPTARRFTLDSEPSVRAAAIYVLRRTGQPVDPTPLAEMLASDNPTLRANAAMLTGLLGDRSAAPMLKDLVRQDMPRVSPVQETLVRLQFSEAILRLGDNSVLDAMRAYACYSQFDEVRVTGLMALGELGDRGFQPAIAKLLADTPIEVQVAAAGALARMGDPAGLDVVLRATQSPLAPARAQAAMALAHFADGRAADRLAQMLGDGAEQVRLSAAAAVLRRGGPR